MNNERFYCVGCKQHYELEVHAAQKQASKGGSFRHSLISECPKGHRVNKLCKKEVYEAHSMDGLPFAAEEGSAPVQDPMEFGEMANWTPLDGTPSLKKRKRAEGMTVGVNLEALEPTPDEPENGESMVPADSLMPEGSGHVIGSQSTSHNYTPFHSESKFDKLANKITEEYEEKGYSPGEAERIGRGTAAKIGRAKYGKQGMTAKSIAGRKNAEAYDAETFIAYPELKNYLVSIMPQKVYDIVEMEDGDFEMKVASRNMDEVIAAVSDYQLTEKSDSDFAFGQSKTTVAVTAAGLAVFGAWLWNKNRK